MTSPRAFLLANVLAINGRRKAAASRATGGAVTEKQWQTYSLLSVTATNISTAAPPAIWFTVHAVTFTMW